MKLLTIVGLIVIVLFFLLPILNNNATIPTRISEIAVGEFLGGVVGYWITIAKVMFGNITW